MSDWTAQVQVKWNPREEKPADWSWLKDWPEVKWAWSTTGDWDMNLWINVDNPSDLEKFVHEKLRSKGWVWETKSTWTKEVWAA